MSEQTPNATAGADKTVVKDGLPTQKKGLTAAERVKERVPFGGFTKKLDVFGDLPGFVLYWINDEGSRIPTLRAHGFEFVEKGEVKLNDQVVDGDRDMGSRISRPVARAADGSAIYAFLMKLPVEFYEQDMAHRAARQRQIDDAINGVGMAVAGVGVAQDGKTYNPAGNQVKNTIETHRRSPGGMVTSQTKTMG